MSKAPPAPVRWFVLVAALSLLVTAVCVKSGGVDEESPAETQPEPATQVAPAAADAGAGAATQQQAVQQQATPPAADAGAAELPLKPTKANEPEVFPATKSAGPLF